MTDPEDMLLEQGPVATTVGRRATWSDWLRVAIPFVVLGALIYWAHRRGYFAIDGPEEVAALAGAMQHRPWLRTILAAIYAGLAAMALPVAPLGYGAGALFGFTEGVVLVWIASMFGAAGGYLLARGIMRGPALRLLGRFAPMIQALRERHGFMTVLRIQLLPLIAFGPFNYAAGIAGIPFWPFMAATGLGILPGTLAIVYVGDRVMAGIRGEEGYPFVVAGVVAVALIALSFLPTILRRRRKRSADS
jgi:uncharacterized membrane protein YdjX (TVP38/TMEM64 family)